MTTRVSEPPDLRPRIAGGNALSLRLAIVWSLARTARSTYNSDVSDSAKKVLADAMALPLDERRRIGYALLVSVGEVGGDDGAAVELSDEWKSEVVRRIGEIERGDVELLDADAVTDELRDRFG
jgi:uncharacterized protein YjeT (DUF2065 family)